MRAPTPALKMSDGQREILESLSKSRTAPHGEVTRAKALLLAAEGIANTAIASRLEVSPTSVSAWRDRFGEEGLAKFGQVRAGRGRRPQIPAEKIEEIVRLTQEAKPKGETHWSCRSMAAAAQVSPATVQRVWSARGFKPHLVKTFKLSNDKHFEEKLVDVVGLYLNPPVRHEAPTDRVG
jgi:transposase